MPLVIHKRPSMKESLEGSHKVAVLWQNPSEFWRGLLKSVITNLVCGLGSRAAKCGKRRESVYLWCMGPCLPRHTGLQKATPALQMEHQMGYASGFFLCHLLRCSFQSTLQYSCWSMAAGHWGRSFLCSWHQLRHASPQPLCAHHALQLPIF